MAINLTRREMLRRGRSIAALAAANTLLPRWMPRLSFAPRYQNVRGDVLVCIFLRGGADGLNMIVPHGENEYYNLRPRLAIPRPDDMSAEQRTVDLDGFWGLHPALAPLQASFQAGHTLAIHACGSPDPTRSHFEAMDYMERGTLNSQDVGSGWIGRHLATLDNGNDSPVRAVGWGAAVQRSLKGYISPVAIQSIVDYHLNGRQDVAAELLASLNSLYALESDNLHIAAQSTQNAIDVVQSVDIQNYLPQHSAVYPENEFAFGLKQTAALIRADVGLEVACLDVGGWDTHAAQGSIEGTQARLLTQLAEGLAAFHADMVDELHHVSVIVMSEFGRRVEENANGGTDHGHGNALLVMNGSLNKTGVYADWRGLMPDALDRGDLPVTTDYRDVMAELITMRLNNPQISEIFPNHTPTSIGLFRANLG